MSTESQFAWNIALNPDPAFDDHESTHQLPQLDLNKSATREYTEELSLAFARIAQLEYSLQKTKVAHTELEARYHALQRVHVRLLTDTATWNKPQHNAPVSLPQAITEIISLRKEITDQSLRLQDAEKTNRYWQMKYQSQQHLLDDHARCIDELQNELQRVVNHQAG